MTEARMRSWSASIGSRRVSTPTTSASLRVVCARDRLELGGLFLRSGVVQEIPAADLRAGEVLEEAWLAKRRVDLAVEMGSWRRRAGGGRLVEDDDVGER